MNKNIKTLKTAGLTEDQAIIYNFLLGSGGVSAAIISRRTGIERSLTYKILERLVNLRLVQKVKEARSVTEFVALHPSRIKEVAEQKKVEAEESYEAVNKDIGRLISSHNLSEGRPGISLYEGSNASIEVTKSILSEGGDVRVFRSFLDKQKDEPENNIKKQIKDRVQKKRKTYVVGPLPDEINKINTDELKKRDKERIVKRRIIKDFNIPTEIILYGKDKVSILDYKNNFSTIIENESVQETFRSIFNELWKAGKTIDNTITYSRSSKNS